MNRDYDYIVVGGGPAGSTVAIALAEAGRSVLVLEASRFPRFMVGEIVAPTALWRVWHRLGISQQTLDELFIRKWAGAWQAPSGEVFRFEQDVHPDDHRCGPFVYTFERAIYDKMLLDLARERGGEVHEEAGVVDLLQDDGGRVTGVIYEKEGERHQASAKLVIDATGRGNLIGRKLGLRMEYTELKSISLFAHYEGDAREEGDAEGDIRIVFDKDIWFWYAPLKGTKASVGLVCNRDVHREAWTRNPEAFYEQAIQSCDFLRERLVGARRETAIPPYRKGSAAYADYHYTCSRMIGDGWAMVGDALGFVDPIFSAGLHVGQTGAIWLSDALLALDREVLPRPEDVQPYVDRYQNGFKETMEHVRWFASYYFDPRFVDFFIKLGNRDSKLRRLYIDTFIAYDPEAIRGFGRLASRFRGLASAGQRPSQEGPGEGLAHPALTT